MIRFLHLYHCLKYMYETYMVNGKSKDALTHRFQCRSFTIANTKEKVEDVCHSIKTFPHVLFFQ